MPDNNDDDLLSRIMKSYEKNRLRTYPRNHDYTGLPSRPEPILATVTELGFTAEDFQVAVDYIRDAFLDYKDEQGKPTADAMWRVMDLALIGLLFEKGML